MSDQELDNASFNKSYRVLKETADWLSKQEEPDIDQLVPRVERAMQAYRICRTGSTGSRRRSASISRRTTRKPATAGPIPGSMERSAAAVYRGRGKGRR